MNSKINLAATALAAVALAGSANAYFFTPSKTNFAASGTLQLTALGDTISCKTTLNGKTSKNGTASITAAKFSGSSPICGLITPTNLPWKTVAKSAAKATLSNVAVSGGGSGCGPSKVSVTVSSGGAFTFNNAQLSGGCSIQGSLQTAPVITIVTPTAPNS